MCYIQTRQFLKRICISAGVLCCESRVPQNSRANVMAADNAIHEPGCLTPYALSKTSKDSVVSMLRGRKLTAFLDYDGTCTPIVKDPDAAVLAPSMKETLSKFVKCFPTTFISGRARDKVKGFVGVEDALYSGSHGFDTQGTLENQIIDHQVAKDFRDALQSAMEYARMRLDTVPGALVEDNKFSVSIHFRNVSDKDREVVEAVVETIKLGYTTLAVRPGKCVYELRPGVEWNKGEALKHILDIVDHDDSAHRAILVMGDDMTDEDMFRASGEWCTAHKAAHPISVVVMDVTPVDGHAVLPRPTAASFYVRNPGEVQEFLAWLIEGTSP